MVPTPETNKNMEPNNMELKNKIDDIKNKTLDSLSDLNNEMANSIVWNPENIKQVKAFPNLWESLDPKQKFDFTSKLSAEIKDSIKELSNLWIEKEFSTEITEKDVKQIADLEFVRANKEKIQQSWTKLEKKANEIAKDMEKEIREKWILDKKN